MNITNEKDFKKELKKCYKDGSNFSMVLYTLMFGDENHKDLKEAYMYLNDHQVLVSRFSKKTSFPRSIRTECILIPWR